MIAYVTLGTNNLQKAAEFYDAVFSELGATRFIENEKFINWRSSPDSPGFSVTNPFDGKPATVGNGVMVSLNAPSRAVVDSVHAKAIELGGDNEGAPGERFQGFYAAYFRDLDGNKISLVCIG